MKAQTEKKEKTTINVVEHSTFEGDMKTNIISSIDMADIVSSLFGPAFADYHGCNVRVNDGSMINPVVAATMPMGAIYVDLFFKYHGDTNSKAITNLTLRGAPKKTTSDNSLSARYFEVNALNNGTNTGRVYTVTKETYEALEEFMPVRGNIRWNDHTQEIATNMSPIGSKEEIIVCISGLSLDKILTKIYGADTDDGQYEYTATPSTVIPNKNREFIMQVAQLNKAAVRKLMRELGVGNTTAAQFHAYR